MKTLAQYFTDWESHTFDFGYGTGETYTVRAVQRFLACCPVTGGYDYQVLEAQLGTLPAWLLINRLCAYGVDIIEYGTSPRYGWLTVEGQRLKAFTDATPTEELIRLCTERPEGYGVCAPDACNCGPTGYEKGRKCGNPFWDER